MIAALLLAAAAPSAIDAERAFAADAQKLGQWTAFRKYATDDALMFVPQPTNAQAFLKDRKDPPKSVEWWPAKAFISCDGTTAVTTGSWVRPGSVGYFTTIWRRQTDGSWKWILDHGDELAVPRPITQDVEITRASCEPAGPVVASILFPGSSKTGEGSSPDYSLYWHWYVSANGARGLTVWQASPGEKTFRPVVVSDRVPAPK